MQKKLKIAMFIDAFYPMVDGVVMVVDNYARRLSKIADVTVFAPMGRDKNYVDNFPYKVVRIKSKKVFFLDYDLSLPKSDKNFKKILNENSFDIFHIHSPFSIGKYGAKFAKKHNIPLVATIHSQFKKDFKKHVKFNFLANLLNKTIIKTFNLCDECWAVNSEIAKMYSDFGIKKYPAVQLNGTDFKYIEDNKNIELLKQKHNIKTNEKVFLFVGRIDILKNIYFILNSLKILKEQGFKFKMFFIGTGIDEEKFAKSILEENMQKECMMLGKITDRSLLASYYNLADMFLFPSLYDANSLVQIEAASQKTPTLFLRGAVTSATITEDVNGFISENDEVAYANKIIDIFNNPDLYKKVSNGAFRDLYISWDDTIKKVYNDYSNLIDNKKV